MVVKKKLRRSNTVMPRRKNGALLPQEQVFVSQYVKTWNGTQSARMAGYKSPATASTRLLKRPAVQEAIHIAEKEVDVLFVRERKTAVDALVEVCTQTDDQKAKVMAAKEILAQSGLSPETKLRVIDDRQMDRDSMVELLVSAFSNAIGENRAQALVSGALAKENAIDVTEELTYEDEDR